MDVYVDIKKLKKKLINKWNKKGPCENFGQKEIRYLRDEYHGSCFKQDGVWNAINEFNDWCMNYDGKEWR